MDRQHEALLALLRALDDAGYRFIIPTPLTHRRFIARRGAAEDLRDIFGWSLPFAPATLSDAMRELLERTGMLAADGERLRSLVRVSSLGRHLFLHSAFPTEARDSVFLGPDSYRFARFVLDELAAQPAAMLVDVGAGAGVGAIMAMAEAGVGAALLTDINPLALRFARINARHEGVAIQTQVTAGLDGVPEGFPLAIMNPPFIADPAKRAYRDGGGEHGAGLSLKWALAAARQVMPGGRVLLYSGSAIVGGADPLERELRARLPADCTLRYREIDPDIFGEELDRPDYAEVERIAAIGAVIERQG